MEFSLKRVKVLCIKELRDLVRNLNVSIIWIFALLLSFVYSMISSGQAEEANLLSVSLNMNSTMIASLFMAMLIAEEKEKNTLRTLMLSAVTPMEFLASKAIITLVISIIVITLVFIMTGISLKFIAPYLVVGTILSICMITIGCVIGILSKSQMETGTISIWLFDTKFGRFE